MLQPTFVDAKNVYRETFSLEFLQLTLALALTTILSDKYFLLPYASDA
jgi:hypothetical protein